MWEEFMETIISASPMSRGEDKWEWVLEGSRVYSSRSAYGWIQGIIIVGR